MSAASAHSKPTGSDGARLSTLQKLAAKRKRDEEEEEEEAAAAAEEEERMADVEAERNERERREREKSALAIKKAAAAAKGTAAASSQKAQHGLKKGKGAAGDEEAGEGDGLSEYEKQRLEKIKKNAEFMASLGIVDVAKQMAPPKKPKAKPGAAKKKRRSANSRSVCQMRSLPCEFAAGINLMIASAAAWALPPPAHLTATNQLACV